MKKPRSYAVFFDGHEEDILYREFGTDGTYLFATKSGVYKFYPERKQWGSFGIDVLPSHFDRIAPTEVHRIDYIQSICIDERKVYQYRIKNSCTVIHGNILVPPKATDAEIRKLILEDLKVEYEEVENDHKR